MKSNGNCPAYCGVACIDGSCPIIQLSTEAYRVKRCENCILNKGCEDCRFDGTEYCIKEGQAAEEKQAEYWKKMLESVLEEQLEEEGGEEEK